MNKNILLRLLITAGSLMSCSSDPIFEWEPPEDFLIEGDTVKNRNDKNNLSLVPRYETVWFFDEAVVGDTILSYTPPPRVKPARLPDLSKLKNTTVKGLAEQPFKLVSAGGDLAFGRRDGGFFNEGMLTSYPTLIANQMGVEFKNPLFDKEDFNGYRRNVESNYNPTGGPVPKRKQAINNLAIRDGKYKVYSGEMDNYYLSANNMSWKNKVGDWVQSPYYAFMNSADKNTLSFANGLKENKLNFDFALIDIGLQNVFGYGMINGSSFWEDISLEELKRVKSGDKVSVPGLGAIGEGNPYTYSNTFKLLVSQNLNKGVIINCPDLQDLPYFSRNFNKDVWEVITKYHVLAEIGWLGSMDRLVLGSSRLDSLLSPNVNINLKPGIASKYYKTEVERALDKTILEKSSIQITKDGISKMNKNTAILSNYSQMPLFDINAFYKNINKGGTRTDDGVEIIATWPGGNFYSTDGIYPSAFGQAVIANEIIKIINKHYGLNIDLLPTRMFLKK